jgi:hypothetical protein
LADEPGLARHAVGFELLKFPIQGVRRVGEGLALLLRSDDAASVFEPSNAARSRYSPAAAG